MKKNCGSAIVLIFPVAEEDPHGSVLHEPGLGCLQENTVLE